LLSPAESRDIIFAAYLPFARRIITAVVAPACAGLCVGVERRLWQIVTRPAPWTQKEKWRIPRPRFDDQACDEALFAELLPVGFEKELATTAEPHELSIWIELDTTLNYDPQRLIGMGLRGRWALIKNSKTSMGWWILELKDCMSYVPHGD